MYSQRELLPWAAAIRGRLGEDPPLFDAHTHLGLDDPAGLLATGEDVVGALEAVDSDALVFALKEPSGVAGGNDKVLELVSGNGDRLKALARLDPGDDPLAEAERCLEAGAGGAQLAPPGGGLGARSGSRCPRGARASSSAPPASTKCSRWPTSAACRS